MSNLLNSSAAIFRALNTNQLQTIFLKDESPLHDLFYVKCFVCQILMICIYFNL